MKRTVLVACAAAGGLFVALAAPPPVQALPSVNLDIAKKVDAVTLVARRGRRYRGPRYVGSFPFRYGYYPLVVDGYYDGGRCAWLKRKAYRTGSAYWRRRYNRCRH